jgi:hypothetical protein
MSKKSLAAPLLAALLAAALSAGHAYAQTTPAQEGDKPAKSKSKSKKTAKAGSGSKAKFLQGSGETPAERTARLKRECKGAVDAGACSGYTR